MTSSSPSTGISRTRLARDTGIGVETIRYYERIGLIDRPLSRQRSRPCHTPEAAQRLLFIKRAQDAGFSLREIRKLLALGANHCDETRSMAAYKLEAINAEIGVLQETARRLAALIGACGGGDAPCPLFVSLARRASRDEEMP